MIRKSICGVLLVIVLFAIGCSSGGSKSPLIPEQNNLTQAAERVTGGKAIWGIWEIAINPDTREVSVTPLRGAQFTVDVVTFLQKPMGNPANLSIKVTDVSKWMAEGILGVDVGLRHPFPGLFQYTGFDVYGVFVAPGSVAGLYDPDVVYTNGVDEPILLNADGYTRWMNPVEFPANGTILRFVPGKLGTQNISLFNSTINAYKYFCDGLEKDQPLAEYFVKSENAQNRGWFRPGSFNERYYYLKFPMVGGSPYLVFQYAVIASWIEPDKTLSGDPNVLDVPGDFAPEANADEAFNLVVTDNSTLFYKDGTGGGNVKLKLEVYDWGTLQGSNQVADEIYQIVVEGSADVIPGGYKSFDKTTLKYSAEPGTSIVSSVFEVEIPNCTPKSNNDVTLLVTIESESPDSFDPGIGVPGNDDRLASYFFTKVKVGNQIPSAFVVTNPNGGETLWMALYHNIKWNPGYSGIQNVKIEWSTDNFVSDIKTIIASTPNTGTFLWKPIPVIDTDTAKIRISDVLGTESDTSDNYFSIKKPVWLEFQNEVDMADSAVTWQSYPYDKSWDEFSPALSQDHDGLAHICWHRERLNPPGRFALDCGIRSMNGTNWNGEGGFLMTQGGSDQVGYELRGDFAKLAATSNNTTYMAIQHWTVYFSADVDMWLNGHYEYNYNCLVNRIYKNCEIMADDTYLYLVSDGMTSMGNGPGVYSVRVPTPNWTWSGPGPTVNIADVGEVSHSRSWQIYNGTLALIYYTLDGRIMLSKQIDAVSDTWDPSEVVFNGAGYLDCANPSIWVDGDGRLFAVWTGQHQATSKYHILASMKETPTSSWTSPLIAVISDTPLDELHATCSTSKILLPTGDAEHLLLIGYEQDSTVQAMISPMDLWAFLPAQKVSKDGDIAADPDTLCMKSPYLFDALFAWKVVITPGTIGYGNSDIRFRNAKFKTP